VSFVVNGLINGEIEKPSVSFFVWLWWVIDLVKFEFKSRTVSFILLLSLFCLKNRVCLSRGVQVAGVAWWATMKIVAGVGDLVQRTGDGRTGRVLGSRMIKRLGDAVCGLHRAHGDEEHVFLGSASKSRSTICLASKTLGQFVSVLASKPLERFLIGLVLKTDGDGLSVVWSQNPWDGFLCFGLKTSGDSFLQFTLKNGGNSFSRFGLKIGVVFLGWAIKSRWCRVF
jgi:hypothetical protein